ncbi:MULTISPECIES: hypothetical protein [Actinomycetes]|uniref:Uncharacterized protein n=1 Tax=Streptosporangium lutulentum TaxID=1461250 RepID=A0ABT9QSQ7_9ACTN|nr:hypothetical protein [Streptosporangium lutulentum]MDP9843554.1 hypothetical protein [Streptosporangium lutulentum]MDP9849790.1 hypothetical protein [Streptosporangium lutulentum]
MINEAFEQLERMLDTTNACRLTGISRATLHSAAQSPARPGGRAAAGPAQRAVA